MDLPRTSSFRLDVERALVKGTSRMVDGGWTAG